MNILEKQELEKQTIYLLEKTKKQMNKYILERKKLDNFLRKGDNFEKWRNFIQEFEQKLENN